MKGPENKFRDSQVIPWLKSIEAYYFIKEAVALRGIPDIIGCYNGVFFALEVKKSESEARKNTGRIVLQKLQIQRIREKKGFASLIYPENMEEVKAQFLDFCAIP